MDIIKKLKHARIHAINAFLYSFIWLVGLIVSLAVFGIENGKFGAVLLSILMALASSFVVIRISQIKNYFLNINKQLSDKYNNLFILSVISIPLPPVGWVAWIMVAIQTTKTLKEMENIQ
ncbi:hypothetical protein NPA08_03955 [Mycoplasmopsis citelli]|uniref:Uncharacterized protein n=1 Tax=Mycoplasmopsis citelli TaxID=171281 RepID=A0A449B254_9BACT|nr:hypothetical protein [Mycoplasmopsis citelli]UUD36080.1 hypothetical protein NPA08_03955 [Mycoplasmopsis citelli]VEU74625.1 Uncharacterised protein [Mycoplasmopsis citelli]